MLASFFRLAVSILANEVKDMVNMSSAFHYDFHFNVSECVHAFFLQITANTRVCSRHFTEEDYKPTDKSGRRCLKNDVVPSVFNWTVKRKERRKILRTETAERYSLFDKKR